MYLSLLLFCTCGTIVNSGDSGDSDDDKKFIDLLPEEEKDAFIESVARRLITGVKTRDSRYKSDEEVSDEALNQHSEYVQKVLQEETGNLRRNSKSKVDSDENLKVQGLDKDRKPIQIQDDNDKNHIDLTLRGNRRKRNENEEIIPVKTVYDDENVRSRKSESKTKDNEDGNQDINTKSKEKENTDENSTIEDIQIRGLRPHPKSKTIRPVLQDATKIGDFEPEDTHEDVSIDNVKPEESNENVSAHTETHEDDSAANKESESYAGHNVTISAETTVDVRPGHNGFTESIFESQESLNESNSHSNESVESVTESTTTATKTIVNVTTDHASTTTQNVVTETSTVGNQSQNTTHKRQYLRANSDSLDVEKDPESNLDKMQKDKNNPYEKSDEKLANVAVEDSKVKVNNNNLNTISNDINLRTENKSNTSHEQGETIKPKSNVSNEDDSFETTKGVEKDVVVYNSDITTTTKASTLSKELESNQEVTQIHDPDKAIENSIKNNEKIKESAIESRNSSEIKDSDTKISEIKYSAEGRISNEDYGYATTTENNQLDDKIHYGKEQVNISYISNNLRSDINSDTTHFTEIEVVPIELNKTQSDDIDDKNESVETTFKQFEGILEDSNKVLTTTEKNYENMSKNSTTVPNYKIYYSSYLSDNVTNDNSKNNIYRDEEGNKLKYKSQRSVLEKINKTLRQGFYQEDIEGDSKESKPKLLQSSGKIKEYLVFEIPADKTPFVPTKLKPKKKPKPKEQPYYVPIYNYSPDNAYYNAYNRLGPNENDNQILEDALERNDNSDVNFGLDSVKTFYIDNLEQPDGHRIFKYKTKKHTPNSNSYGLPLMIKNPKVTKIYFNPDEYLDVDYYFERSRNPDFRSKKKKRKQKRYGKKKTLKSGGQLFPDSEDSGHPFYSMANDDVKSHISAVRQILYKQKQFGFVPGVTSPKIQCKNVSKHEENYNHYEYDYGDVNVINEDHYHHEHMSFRTSNLSEHPLLLPNGKQKNDKPNQKDISVDYYFGLYNTESHPEGKRYEDFIRASKARNLRNNNEKSVYKQNKNMLTNLIGEIKRIRRTAEAAKNLEEKNFKKEITKWKDGAGTIKDILEMTDSSNVFPTLNKLKDMNLNLMRRKDRDDSIEVYTNVLRDMIKMENRALNKFDWLGSTVDILGAVEKLKYITEHHHHEIHPSDFQLLKYVLFLYKSSKSSLELVENEEPMLRGPRKKHNALPRNKKRKKAYLTAGLLNRVWLYIRDRNGTQIGVNRKNQDFLQFLDDLRNSLFDLHYALKHISMVTKYKNQQWFQNLKSLYLKGAEKKEILELLLHIFTSRLLGLIEESAVNGLEDGYLEYVKHNKKQVERTKEDFVFVLKLLNEIKNKKTIIDDLDKE